MVRVVHAKHQLPERCSVSITAQNMDSGEQCVDSKIESTNSAIPLDRRNASVRQHTFTFRKAQWPNCMPAMTKTVEVYFHSDDVMIIHKPPNFIIDGDEWSVQECLQREYPDYPLFYLIHQLDYATSGIMCLGLNKRATARICQLFRDRLVRKEYVAIVRGWVQADHLNITESIADDPTDSCRMRIGNAQYPGRPAHTTMYVAQRGYFIPPIPPPHINISAQLSSRDPIPVTLVHLNLLTGRRHQLRVHMAAQGHPIMGDITYEDTPPNGISSLLASQWPYQSSPPTPRMFLHAHYIQLPLRRFYSRGVRVWNYDISVHIPSEFESLLVCGCRLSQDMYICHCATSKVVDNITRWEKQREIDMIEERSSMEKKQQMRDALTSKRQIRRCKRSDNKVTNMT